MTTTTKTKAAHVWRLTIWDCEAIVVESRTHPDIESADEYAIYFLNFVNKFDPEDPMHFGSGADAGKMIGRSGKVYFTFTFSREEVSA